MGDPAVDERENRHVQPAGELGLGGLRILRTFV